MKHFFLPTLAVLAMASSAAQAQTTVTFGPRLGVNLSKFSYSGTPQQFDDVKSMAGVQVGATANISFGNLAFQPSLVFSQKGAELKSTGRAVSDGFPFTYTVTASPKLNYIELPLNFVYTTGGDHGFQVFAGPYVALGVGGGGSYNVAFTSTDPDLAFFNGDYPGSLKVEYGTKQNDNAAAQTSNNTNSAPPLVLTFHRLDAGLNGGVGYRVGPFQAQLGYGLGLVNFVPNDPNGQDTGSKGYNRSFQLAANYFFGSK
ncbi:MAG: PorT family protein [Hymenobacter sp.]|nr:PorT family protein [Hymenobacter sp.]